MGLLFLFEKRETGGDGDGRFQDLVMEVRDMNSSRASFVATDMIFLIMILNGFLSYLNIS